MSEFILSILLFWMELLDADRETQGVFGQSEHSRRVRFWCGVVFVVLILALVVWWVW